jgi:hypothetical protein
MFPDGRVVREVEVMELGAVVIADQSGELLEMRRLLDDRGRARANVDQLERVRRALRPSRYVGLNDPYFSSAPNPLEPHKGSIPANKQSQPNTIKIRISLSPLRLLILQALSNYPASFSGFSSRSLQLHHQSSGAAEPGSPGFPRPTEVPITD